MPGPVYCTMSVHPKEPQVADISRALHYFVSHNRVAVLGRKTPEIIIMALTRLAPIAKSH